MHPSSLLLLLGAAATVAILHSILPDHWVPLAIVARTQRWSILRVTRVSALASVGHVVSSLVLGGIIALFGLQFQHKLETQQGHLIGGILVLTGIGFLIWGLVGGGHEHRHEGGGHMHEQSFGPGHTYTETGEHDHDHSHEQALTVGSYLWNTASVRTLLVFVAVVSLLGRSYPTVLPIVVSRTWGGGARTYGLLAALPGIGAALAAVFVVWLLGQRERTSPMWLGGILLGVALVCFGMAWSLVVAGFALLATGWFATGTMTLLNARVQETTPNEVRGRVMSLYTWLAAGMPALGGWGLGTLMGFFPPRWSS